MATTTFKIGSPVTITINLESIVQPSDLKIRDIVKGALYPQFAEMKGIDRKAFSGNFTITFIPNRPMTARQWKQTFVTTFINAGYPKAWVVDIVGGTESRDPGGLLSSAIDVFEDVGEIPVIKQTLGMTKWIAIAAVGFTMMYFLPKPKWSKK